MTFSVISFQKSIPSRRRRTINQIPTMNNKIGVQRAVRQHGGFTKEAKYEAERMDVPLTLIDLDELVDLVIQDYDNFDAETKVLIPLTKIYWPK
jgi:predicted Mrr-cat superfamily restriction endonuclease